MTNADDDEDFFENTLNLTNSSFRSHHILKVNNQRLHIVFLYFSSAYK